MSDVFDRIEQEIPRLRRYAWAITRDHSAAEDLVQDSLTRALVKAHLWQPGTDLRAWLCTILHNEHINTLRRSVRTKLNVEVSHLDRTLAIGASQIHSVELSRLDNALAKLPEGQRQAVLLIGLEGFSYDEASEILGVPVGTVRSRLSRGRDTLRALMGKSPVDRSGRKPETVPRRLRSRGEDEAKPARGFGAELHGDLVAS